MKSLKIIALTLIPMLASCHKEAKVSIDTVTVERGELTETVTATGEVESVTSVDVGTQVTGIIDKLFADYNTEVKKGQLIAELEKTTLESDLRSAEANVESARATYEYNATNHKRNTLLHDKQLISDYEFETSQKDLEVSRTAYDKAKADRVRAAKNLNYAEIYSPMDGIVISREVEVGQTVVSNMSVANLYTIADLDNMQVIGNVDEADIGSVKVGQPVTFTVDAYPDDVFNGTVTQVRLSPTTESNVVTYEVVVSTTNPDHKLIPGLTANLTIYVIREENLLLVPNQVFNFNVFEVPESEKGPKIDPIAPDPKLSDNQKTVWILTDGVLTQKVVETGITNGIKTSIVSGLTEGDRVASGVSIQTESSGAKEGQKSPFAPTPPGRNKKK